MKKRKFLLSGGPFVSMFSLLIGPIFKYSSYQASGCDELIRHENDENHQKTSYNADVFHCRTWLVKLRLLSVGPIIRNYIKLFWKSSFFLSCMKWVYITELSSVDSIAGYDAY